MGQVRALGLPRGPGHTKAALLVEGGEGVQGLTGEHARPEPPRHCQASWTVLASPLLPPAPGGHTAGSVTAAVQSHVPLVLCAVCMEPCGVSSGQLDGPGAAWRAQWASLGSGTRPESGTPLGGFSASLFPPGRMNCCAADTAVQVCEVARRTAAGHPVICEAAPCAWSQLWGGEGSVVLCLGCLGPASGCASKPPFQTPSEVSGCAAVRTLCPAWVLVALEGCQLGQVLRCTPSD